MNKVKQFFITLFPRLKEYFKKSFKSLNYVAWIIAILVAVGLFLSDYFTKIAAFHYLTNGDPDHLALDLSKQGTPIIPGILDMTFTQNLGAAWGSFSGQMWLLTIISSIASVMLTINLLFRFNRYNKIMMTGVVLMAPGAIGNLVDRIGCLAKAGIYKGGVIDFLHFTFWPSFPICNLADYYLSIGIVFLIIGFVIEFKKEYKALKAEEEAEKLALEQGKDVTGESQEDLLKKLQEKEKENKEEVDSENRKESGEEKQE